MPADIAAAGTCAPDPRPLILGLPRQGLHEREGGTLYDTLLYAFLAAGLRVCAAIEEAGPHFSAHVVPSDA